MIEHVDNSNNNSNNNIIIIIKMQNNNYYYFYYYYFLRKMMLYEQAENKTFHSVVDSALLTQQFAFYLILMAFQAKFFLAPRDYNDFKTECE